MRNEARFEDSVGISPEFIDGYGVLILPTTGRYMHIPYRAMLPKLVKNLLVTGRAIGGDRIAHAATRNMACCAVAGQGAGWGGIWRGCEADCAALLHAIRIVQSSFPPQPFYPPAVAAGVWPHCAPTLAGVATG